MIKAFADRRTAAIFVDVPLKGIPADVRRRARVKLIMLDRAKSLQDLRAPPGNRLEALKKDRAGQHRIRVNDQWRICFLWRGSDAYAVEFCDYH
ncbi:MAG TPA: type II toxin-antitoxin system RelE/ParE family toxin [Stellaceae bacterium]|nr:type II toxin-antitoxin system RelE/ParE family toxin [Stellaceae bacterium]